MGKKVLYLFIIVVDDLGFDRSVRLVGEVMRMHCPKSRLGQRKSGTAKTVNCNSVCLIHTIQCGNN